MVTSIGTSTSTGTGTGTSTGRVVRSLRDRGTVLHVVLVNTGTSTGILKVPVLVVFFDINMSGLKKHFWPHMQAGWGRTGHTFGLFFWPHVQPKVVTLR